MSVQSDGAAQVLVNRASRREMIRRFRGVVRKELLTIPEWLDDAGEPVVVEIRSLTGSERADYMNAMQSQADADGKITRVDFRQALGLLAFFSTFTGEDDERVFDNPEDALEFDAAVLQRINDKAQEMSGINTEEVEEAGNA